MELKGTVKLKKMTPGGAVYAMSVEGAQTANLVVPVLPDKLPGIEGTVVIDIPAGNPPKPPKAEPEVKAKKRKK